MMTRRLRYSAASYENLLKRNDSHIFAQQHALRLYGSNAIYSFIPKNACSTMRLSLAVNNGILQDIADYKWIRNNNYTFSADLASLCTAAYSFVILRCPYARLASVFLNKIVEKPQPRLFLRQLYRRAGTEPGTTEAFIGLYNAMRHNRTISFFEFVSTLKRNEAAHRNPHWRPQVDFLVYSDYDDYFCVEDFASVATTLKKKIGFDIVDARGLTMHGTNRFRKSEPGDFSRVPAFAIRQLMASGECPSQAALYNDEVLSTVSSMYADDLALYMSIFGVRNLLFS